MSRLRRLRHGIATVLDLERRGFFIPFRHADVTEAADYPALEDDFAAAWPRFATLVDAAEGYRESLCAIQGPPPEPRFDQDWFARLDAAAAYTIVRMRRPRRIVEIGSGHSTRFLVRAARDEGLPTVITCIDPAPRADIAKLPVEHIATVVQAVPAEPFAALEAGDVLFIDSSHVLMPGTDVDFLLNGILPRLAPGVLVHVHDVFLPDAYPETWAWRGYNEQQAVACLMQGGAYELLFASRYVTTRHADALEKTVIGALPLVPGAFECSLWLEKCAST